MFKTSKFFLLSILLIMFVFLCGCQDNKKYMADTQQTFKLLTEYNSMCYKILERYSMLASSDTLIFMAKRRSEERYKDIFYRFNAPFYKEHADKFNMLESKTIEEHMANLRNPPRKYENIYNKMLELYGAYTKIQGFAVNKSGSGLIDGFGKINQAIGDFSTLSKQLEVMLGDPP